MSNATPEITKQKGTANKAVPDLEQLRHLLLGKDYRELLALKKQLNNPQMHSEKVAAVVSEALAIRLSQDKSLTEVLSPTMEDALTDSIERDPKRLANALYPVMGPAIRKSINEVLSQTFETFNQLLEQSLSPKSLLWRFDAWRTGRSYPEVVLLNTLEYQVEQVFLIHRESGLLLRHAVSPQAISKDPDMVSGMLTAIQDFIADSFEVNDGETLSRLHLGELTVLVDQGPYAVIAAVVRGNVPGSLPDLLRQTQENIHQQMANTLSGYEGDSEPFVRIHPLLEKCLLVQVQEKKKRKPWLMYLVLLGLLAALAYWGYTKYQNAQAEKMHEQHWQMAVDKMNAEPGVVVIDAKRQGNMNSVSGLLDPLARHPDSFLNNGMGEGTTFSFKPYLSTEQEIVIRRAHQVLQPPENTELALESGNLKVSGRVDIGWRRKLDQLWPNIAGVNSLDDSELEVTNVAEQRRLQQLRVQENQQKLKQQQLEQQEKLKQQQELRKQQQEQQQLQQQQLQLQKSLVRDIEATRHYFGSGKHEPEHESIKHIAVQARRIRELMTVTKQQNKVLQVRIMGNSDQSGSQKLNDLLAQKRAINIYQRLVGLGIPDYVLRSPVENVQGQRTGTNKRRNERSVHYLINVY